MRVLHFFRTHWWPWLAIVGFVVFLMIGNNRYQSNQQCDKVDKLGQALISIVTAQTTTTRYPVTIVRADGTRETATIEVKPRNSGGGETVRTLREAACDPSHYAP